MYMDLDVPITFDNIPRCFYVCICFMVVNEAYNVNFVFRGFSSLAVCQDKNKMFHSYNITIRTKFIVRNTSRINCSSCIAKTEVLNCF